MRTVAVASSPASYGATSLTVGAVPYVLGGDRVLDEVRAAGYHGIELGPDGYLGSGRGLIDGLIAHELGVSSVVVEIPFVDPDVDPRHELDGLLDVVDSLRDRVSGPVPRVVLMDAGDERRRADPGVAHLRAAEWGLDAATRERFALGLNTASLHCRRRGYVAALRPRAGSYVEAPWEIDAALGDGDVALCLDTGQVLIGGGDPVAVLRQWADRVALVYLKDAILSRMQDIVDEGEPAASVWSREVFCALGDGDVDCVGVLQQLEAVAYSGWLVVEQDAYPSATDRIIQAVVDQRRNREFLRRHDY